ncbi:hypothetical protein BH10ACT1_BH10ACT1_11960 [soil metagenome]
MTIRLSDLAGRPILDVSTAKTIGTVGYGIVDPTRNVLAALHLAKSSGSGPILPWESIKAIGPDALTIDSVELTRPPIGHAEQRAVDGPLDPIGRRILTERGTLLGTVVDLAVDEISGSIEQVITDTRSLEGGAISGIGGYALIVTDPA